VPYRNRCLPNASAIYPARLFDMALSTSLHRPEPGPSAIPSASWPMTRFNRSINCFGTITPDSTGRELRQEPLLRICCTLTAAVGWTWYFDQARLRSHTL
jgi:hypothetical protein